MSALIIAYAGLQIKYNVMYIISNRFWNFYPNSSLYQVELVSSPCIFHQMEESHYQNKNWPVNMALPQISSQKLYKPHESCSQVSIIAIKPAKGTKSFMPWVTALLWFDKRYLWRIQGIGCYRSETNYRKSWLTMW